LQYFDLHIYIFYALLGIQRQHPNSLLYSHFAIGFLWPNDQNISDNQAIAYRKIRALIITDNLKKHKSIFPHFALTTLGIFKQQATGLFS